MNTFDVIAGDPRSPVLIHVPHASRHIPDDVRAGIVLDDAALSAELDAFTDVIADRAADLADVRPWIFVNRLSRLVVDPERFPDDREEMTAVGMGAVYTRTSQGAVLREPDPSLVGRFFEPYAAALADLVDARLQSVADLTIIDLHSFPLVALPYELHGDGHRPEICLGTDSFHTHSDHVATAIESFADFTVGLDSPFVGTYVPDRHWGEDDRVDSLMVEVRRDLYLDDRFDLVEPALAPIVAALTKLIDVVSLVPVGAE